MSGYTGSIADHGRVIHIAKRRERHKEDIELKRRKIAAENSLANIGDKFAHHYDAVEQQLKSATVGLVTLEEMKARRETVIKEREKQLAFKHVEVDGEARGEGEKSMPTRSSTKKSCLSFDFEEDEEDDEEENEPSPQTSPPPPAADVADCSDDETPTTSHDPDPAPATQRRPMFKKLGKDPTVDTSFLPDVEREEAENRLREELRLEWVEKQERVKSEEINIAFSYWDGSGHRRDVKMKKGQYIHQFLQAALDMLRKDFNELKTASADSLMFVKEDLIIPHFYTFHDFIVTRAIGKTGPLFEFDAAGELRVRGGTTQQKSESHPAKVVLRSWYERNKHIYPASRWEPFDPNKRYDKISED